MLPDWLVVVFWIATIFLWPSGLVIGIALRMNANPLNKAAGRGMLVATGIIFLLFALAMCASAF